MHTLAARNNADWCDLYCRASGVGTAFEPDRWVALRRSPPMYPDVVTLTRGLSADQVLAGVDASAGCSVKDSFADLDLPPFRVLFEAEWIHLATPPSTATGLTWRSERTTAGLPVDPSVVVLAAYDGDVLAGGVIGNRSEHVVGLSNLFTVDGADPDRVWPGAAAAVATCFPGVPLVGYEHGDDLAAAHRAGFRSVGALRVWMR
jgi:hypothetical protein